MDKTTLGALVRFVVIMVALGGAGFGLYTAINHFGEQARIEAEAEAEAARAARALRLQQEADLAALEAQVEAGDLSELRPILRSCLRNVDGSGAGLDRKDPQAVESALRRYGNEGRLAYVGLPTLSEDEVFQMAAERAFQRNLSPTEVSIKLATVYQRDSFSGILDFWGILTCTLTGRELTGMDMRSLHVE